MKLFFSISKSRNLLLCGILLAGLLLPACESPHIDQQVKELNWQEIPAEGAYFTSDLPFPVGTQGYVKGNQMRFVFPEKVKLVQWDAQHEAATLASSVTVTCTASANCSQGCEPHLLSGMSIPTCSPCDPNGTCTMKTSSEGDEQRIALEIGEEVSVSAFFLDLRQGFQAVDAESFSHLASPPALLFELPAVQSAYEAFLSPYQAQGFQPSWALRSPESVGYQRVNAFGYAVLVMVPQAAADLAYFDTESGSRTPICNCASGSGCTLENVYTGGFPRIKIGVKCKRGSCSDCSMTIEQ